MEYSITAICTGKIETLHYDHTSLKSAMNKVPLQHET